VRRVRLRVRGASDYQEGKKYFYYTCRAGRTNNFGKGRPQRVSYVTASWLEETVWADVRRFLEDPGEVLESARERLGADDATDDLETRREELGRRLAAKQAEKDRYVHLYAQGHISESELEMHLLDLKNQTENLRLLLGSVEAELSQKRAPSAYRDSACVACGAPGAHRGSRGGHGRGVPGKAAAREA
jgi:hypothetical protein